MATLFTGLTHFALFAATFWVAGERLMYHRNKGNRWLSEEMKEDFKKSLQVFYFGKKESSLPTNSRDGGVPIRLSPIQPQSTGNSALPREEPFADQRTQLSPLQKLRWAAKTVGIVVHMSHQKSNAG